MRVSRRARYSIADNGRRGWSGFCLSRRSESDVVVVAVEAKLDDCESVRASSGGENDQTCDC